MFRVNVCNGMSPCVRMSTNRPHSCTILNVIMNALLIFAQVYSNAKKYMPIGMNSFAHIRIYVLMYTQK